MSVLHEFRLLPGIDLNFTDADKDACMPIIALLVDSHELARKEGFIAFEKYSEKHSLPYTLEFAFELLADDLRAELVKDILKTLIISGGYSGRALLERLLILEGVLALLGAERPRIAEYRLLSMLGESHFKQIWQGWKEQEQKEYDEYVDKRLSQIMATPTDTDYPEESAFGKTLKRVSSNDMERLMRDVDDRILAVALKMFNDATAASIFRGISQSRAKAILDDMRNMGPIRVCDVKEAQKEIEDVFEKLQGAGEIASYKNYMETQHNLSRFKRVHPSRVKGTPHSILMKYTPEELKKKWIKEGRMDDDTEK